MPTKNTNIAIIFKRLNKFYKTHKFGHRSPFKTLISTILSQRTKDENTVIASEQLYKFYDTPTKLAVADPKKVEKLIRPAGFYKVKTKHIQDVSRVLIEQYNGKVPTDFDKLMELPGVGRKTANVVLNVAFGQPTIGIDTHAFRIANRTGLAPGKTPLKVEETLNRVVPDRYKHNCHHWLILQGRYVCKARKPECWRCVVEDICLFKPKSLA